MRWTRWLRHPTRVVPLVYLLGIAVGTALLWHPAATAAGTSAPFIHAAFTAVSAVCITGLVTVDTATFWSPFGQFVIMLLIQVGGFGIVTLASLLTMVATGRISLRGSMLVGQEIRRRNVGDILRVPKLIALVMLVGEAITAIVLTLGFRAHTDGWGQASWYGTFHAVSAFNNAGFALFSDNLIGFASDPAIIIPICVAVVVGGLGFPVVLEVGRRLSRRGSGHHWSVHTRLTLLGTLWLLLGAAAVFGVAEWNNPNTLGGLPRQERALGILSGAVFPRTAGFNAIDYADASDATVGLYYGLMFIGGGSAGTAGGIKVGTIGIVLATVIAELRGEPQAVVGNRAIPADVQRSALTVVILGLGAVAAATFFIVADERFTLQEVLFETISAFGTVGLSTGITPHLHAESLVVLMLLMYLGRVGTVTVAAALAIRSRHRHYVLPEEQTIVG